MNKSDIINAMKLHFAQPEDAEKAIELFFRIVKNSLKQKEKVVISSFGTFIPLEKKPALRRNPRTNEKIMTAVRKKVRFKPSRKLLSEI